MQSIEQLAGPHALGLNEQDCPLEQVQVEPLHLAGTLLPLLLLLHAMKQTVLNTTAISKGAGLEGIVIGRIDAE